MSEHHMSNKIKIKKKKISTLTYRVAAVQVKMMHIQYRLKKIHDDQEIINEKLKNITTNRDILREIGTTVYSTVDMLITMEHLYQLTNDIFSTTELTQHFNKKIYQIINNTKKIAKKWKFVRNKLGGHIDINTVEDFCDKHNFKGVFISDDFECDVSALNMILIESAVNSARSSYDIFARDLDLRKDLPGEMKLLVDELNKDWNEAFLYFEPLMKLMYKVGKKEKISWAGINNLSGIVTGE